MAQNSVVQSPECNNFGRREAPAVGAVVDTGAFVEYVVGGVGPATAAEASNMVAVENIATAQDETYQYAVGENVFFQSLPRGCLVRVKAVAATYAVGDKVEIGAGGAVTALSLGTAVGVVPSFGGETVASGGTLLIELL